MTASSDTGLGHGSQGSPQETIQELEYNYKRLKNEDKSKLLKIPRLYKPSPKHNEIGGWGSINPIKSQEEGQNLLDTGYKKGKQIYNVTSDGKIVKFQPDNTPENSYHSYEVKNQREIPNDVLKDMLKDGKISNSLYNKIRKGKL